MNRITTTRIAFVFAAFIGLPIYWAAFPPREPISLANGRYWNECCEIISLNNGQMSVSHDEVSYVVEYDKGGSYVLPHHLVGVREGYIFIERGSGPLKLRLDAARPPQSIDLVSDPSYLGHQTFSFRRIPERGINRGYQ